MMYFFLLFRLPWDQTTFFGYFPTIAYATLFSTAYFVLNAMFLAAFVVICLQFQSLRIHFEGILSQIKQITKIASIYDKKLKAVFSKAIQFHILMRK